MRRPWQRMPHAISSWCCPSVSGSGGGRWNWWSGLGRRVRR
ncbi:hypothetical protein ACFPRL_19520 [Pseudoclavibacter helvolus]